MNRRFSGNDILKMFDMRTKGFTLAEIGSYFGVSRQFTDKILKRESYADVHISTNTLDQVESHILTRDLYRVERDINIREMYATGLYSQMEVAAYMKCGAGTVHRAIHG